MHYYYTPTTRHTVHITPLFADDALKNHNQPTNLCSPRFGVEITKSQGWLWNACYLNGGRGGGASNVSFFSLGK